MYIWYNQVTEYHFWKVFIVTYPTYQAVWCCHQGQSQAEVERNSKVGSFHQCSGKISIVRWLNVKQSLCITVFV